MPIGIVRISVSIGCVYDVAIYSLPADVIAAVVNPTLKDICNNSQMILMKLPSQEANSAQVYMATIRSLVKDLPPILLMNSSTHLPVITRYILIVCLSIH